MNTPLHPNFDHPEPTLDLSVVIPAYNERRRILPTIASTVAYLQSTSMSWEIIVSDDGSTDDTADLVRTADVDGVRLLTGEPNKGKGAAVRRGIRAARGRAVLVSDADMSTPIQHLDAMLDQLGASSMVIGSRALDDAGVTGKSRLRNMLSDGLGLIVRNGLGIDVADTQCGFKLMTHDVANTLANEARIDGFSFDIEWLMICGQRSITVVEHPVDWFDAPGSTVDPLWDSVRFVRDIAKVRWLRRGAQQRRSPTAVNELDIDEASDTANPADGRHQRDPASRHIAVVTSLPPSTRTLNEYGFHLVSALSQQPEVDHITVLRDDTVDHARSIEGVSDVAAWTPNSWLNPFRILRAARAARVGVVMFNIQFATFGDRRIPAALGLLTPALLRMFNIPTVVLIHNLVDTVDLEQAGFASSKWKIRVLRSIGRTLTRCVLAADKVAVTLPTYFDILTHSYGADNVYLSPHGTFPHQATPRDPHSSRSILTFGKFGTYKRVEDLIAAFSTVRARGHRDVELVIAGSNAVNSPDYLETVAASLPDDLPVRFTGYVEEDDVPQLFEDADMVVFPYSATTGSSGPLHQAGAAGKPAVLPAIGDFVAVITEEGFAGELFDPGDVNSLADAIGRLLDDDELSARLGQQNLRSASALDIELIAGWHAMHLAGVTHS